MIQSMDIPKESWKSFFRTLSRLALDRPIRLEVERRGLGDQEMGRYLPLRSFEYEARRSEPESLMIVVGSGRGTLMHLIETPVLVCIGHNEAAQLEWLAIGERDEGKTIVYFEHPAQLPAEHQQGV
jgi:hypothetical protein